MNRAIKIVILVISTCCIFTTGKMKAQQDQPLRLGVAGVSHGHIWEVVNRIDRGDFIIVGVAESNDELRAQNALTGKIDPNLFFANLDEMLDKTQPEAVIVYESIFDHLRVVESCAPRGIDVMVEKPLAVNREHANRMAKLVQKYNINLLTNYETTWYDTNHEAYRLIKDENAIGNITRMNIYDGHEGPIEIGCGKEFTDWLTDPVLNGGGAVIDFGCYGANLATWFFEGKKPESVYAVLQQQKPALYPKVDDDATIILTYPDATVSIMASWNWPKGRKDMHIYGSQGYIYQDTPTEMRVYTNKKESKPVPAKLQPPYNDPFYLLKAVVRKEIYLPPYNLSCLENNLIVVEILDAAIRSAKTGRAIYLK